VLGNRGLKARASTADRDSVGRSLRGRIEAQGYTMAQLAFKLSEALHQPVLDGTDIDGKFDFELEWATDDMQARLPSADQNAGNGTLEIGAGPFIFTALQEQLGLKLEPGKISAEVLVIDSAERPSEN
jgi:uncharacterized protein (TIGR03435 family)